MSEKRFVGTWKLLSFEGTTEDGVSRPLYGADPVGMIMYDAAGNMSVQIMKRGRPLFALADWPSGTPQESKTAFDGYLAYFGRYDVNEAEGCVVHHMEGSLFPNWIGGDIKRFYTFSGNRLVLAAPPTNVGGVMMRTLTLVWERVV
jgi:hypothetical protein